MGIYPDLSGPACSYVCLRAFGRRVPAHSLMSAGSCCV
uniref:Uncharacterized protein n=1 Tax=Anguilla anguilla TaxID=7936 RepID=A0A0E9QED1_ANGAN